MFHKLFLSLFCLLLWHQAAASDRQTEGIESLGKTLFFDARVFPKASCTQCHMPGLQWSDGRRMPIGLGRNTLSLENTHQMHSFFWDGGSKKLSTAIEKHLSSLSHYKDEQASYVKKVQSYPGYINAFHRIFHADPTAENIVASLAAFINGMRSKETPFDRWQAGEQQALSPAAKRGYQLFKSQAHCAQCHTAPLFSDQGFHLTGVNSVDLGHYEHSKKSPHRYAFRTPSLRNIEKTAPYFHDGSAASLMDVINFYSRGGDRPNSELTSLGLSKQQKRDLLSFLQSLSSDPVLITVPQLPY